MSFNLKNSSFNGVYVENSDEKRRLFGKVETITAANWIKNGFNSF